mgnify:FL=1
MEKIERLAVEIAQETLGAQEVELRPISGHVAGAAVLMGLCRPGDLVLEPGRDGGGHREAGKLSGSALAPLEVQYLPFDGERYNIDVPAAQRLIAERRPRAVILGSSNHLCPHPVRAIAGALKTARPDGLLIYDASHVMGFLAAGRFQDPLREGADLVFGSTHKTLPGPQGGIIFSNRADLMDSIAGAVYPALVTNHHAFRIPALALALLEMRQFGAAYCDRIVANAQALGAALAAEGVPCVCVDGSYTGSHTLLACVSAFGSGENVAARLEDAGLIVTAAHLPACWGSEGVRIGLQEVTRLGATEADMPLLAGWFREAAAGARSTNEIARDAAAWAARLGPVRYTWGS